MNLSGTGEGESLGSQSSKQPDRECDQISKTPDDEGWHPEGIED
jgi:hypothetical protein